MEIRAVLDFESNEVQANAADGVSPFRCCHIRCGVPRLSRDVEMVNSANFA